jgi:hypothetical protein
MHGGYPDAACVNMYDAMVVIPCQGHYLSGASQAVAILHNIGNCRRANV